MSYIAFDLDALNRAPAVARAAGLTEDSVVAGLVRLWAWCFREETDLVRPAHLRGHFGGDVGDALEAFGFLEAQSEGGWRVRGAARYLRIKSAQRAAAERTNQRKVDRTVGPRSSDAPPDGLPHGTPHGTPDGGLPLLHRAPSTDDRTPTSKHMRDIWNANKAPEMPEWRDGRGKGADKRAAAAADRWRDGGDAPEAFWTGIVKRLAASDFARGKGRSGWVANPTFLLRPETATKVLEGHYDNRPQLRDVTRGVAEVSNWEGVQAGEVAL